MGGFPAWTLIGMGISALGAVIFTALAFFAQSPNLLARFRLLGTEFASNTRRLTGLGLASTLLVWGFFMAGVPLGNQLTDVVQPVDAPATTSADGDSNTNSIAQIEDSADGATGEVDAIESESAETGGFGSAAATQPANEDEAESEPNGTSVSGSFGRPAEGNDDSAEEAAESASSTPTPTPVSQAATVAPTNTPTPTATPSPIPTATPTPTITPTAIKADTISVSFDGSVRWVYRVPGDNSRLQLINNGDQLFLESGRAMVKGVTWQEVRLLDGRLGWIQLRFLDLGEE